jgi:signal transduction histidine kinase/DNA-binding response OmpR family regulator
MTSGGDRGAASSFVQTEPSTSAIVGGPPALRTKILIVDDLPEKFLAYEAILEDLGQTLVYAATGAEALKLVLRDDFAVILLDVNMPGMDGFEAASLIRRRRKSASTPIIFLTAFADEIRIAQGYASGAVDYISTPVVPEILRAKVRVFVELFQMRQQAALQAEEHAKKLAAEEAARRFAFLAGAGDRLNRSLDFDTTLRTFVDIAIPYLADVAFVQVDGMEAAPLTACAWRDSNGRSGFERSIDAGWLDALAPEFGRPVELAFNEGNPIAAMNLAGGSLVRLRIETRGRPLGVLALIREPVRPSFQESDVSLAQDIANRGAAALENSLLVQKIRETDRRKDEFIATLAHELRNPLAPMRNVVEILRRIDIVDPKILKARDIIDRQVRQLTRLVDDLLDVSRINSGKVELRRERIDVASVIERAVEISRAVIDAGKHELAVKAPSEPLCLDADPVRIAQVAANLLNNAAKYTSAGGRIEISASRDGDEAVIAVRDNGMGVPPKMLNEIFDMFTQVESALDRSQGGLGVGLSLTRKLVELHGGTVTAFSEGLGKGSEFVVRLPLSLDRPEIRPDAGTLSRIDPPGRDSLRILIVDDNRDSAESLSYLLHMQGRDVRTAYDGRSALAIAEELRPNAVFLDIGMPEMNGYEVAGRLRGNPATQGAVLIALTGWGQDEDRRRTAEAGFQFHCVKPISMEDLEAVLDAAARSSVQQS